MAPRLNFLPIALSKTLLEFQQEGVLFGISKDGRCLIGDEMGLGKTLQALSIAYYYKQEWPLLIVCPSSMRFPWIEEIEKWLPDIEPGEINLVLSGTDASNIKTSKISLVGYGLLSHPSSRLLINCLKDTKFGVVIVDESHYMKNRQASRTKALISVIKKVKRAVLLTGTPALARPEELYVQIDVLKPKLLGSFSKFSSRFCDAHMEVICGGKIRKWNTRGASNLDELHNILKTNVMVRRLKRNVLTQLPPKRRQRITFDLADSDSKKELDNVIKEFRVVQGIIRGRHSSQTVKNPISEMNRLATLLYTQTGLSKISAVRQYIADMLENSDKKFLVFAHHRDMIKAVELEVVKKKVKYIRIAGDVPSVLRGSLVNKFQNDGTVRVAILSLLAASVGITLTAADHIIFTELHWTPGVMEQAEDRVHRIGQENSVLVQYLVAKGTIDEVLWRMLCNKVYVTTATLNGKTQGLDVEEGSEGQSRLLEAFSAWIEEDEEQEAAEEEFLFTNSQKKRKQDALQRSLTEFFHSASSPKCRKTDSGKAWVELSDSSSEEEKTEIFSPRKPSTPEVQECTIEEEDEESCLRKITKKTYKVSKKKSLLPKCSVETRAKTEQIKIVEPSDSKKTTYAADNAVINALEMTDSELTHEYYKMEEEKERDMLNMLSNYTRIMEKPTPPSLQATIDDEVNINESELMATKTDRGGTQSLAGSPPRNHEVIDLTEDCSPVNIEQKKTSHEPEDDCSMNIEHAKQSPDFMEDCSVNTEHETHNRALTKQKLDLTDNCSAMNMEPTKQIHATGDVSDNVAKKHMLKTNDSAEMENLNDFQHKDPWCCTLCTFSNSGFLSLCEMCETPRHKSRRKMAKTALATPEFVKRRQQRILKKCLGPEKKNKSRGSTSKETNFVEDRKDDRCYKRTFMVCDVSERESEASEEKVAIEAIGVEMTGAVGKHEDFSLSECNGFSETKLPKTEHEAEGLPKTEREGLPKTEREGLPKTEHEVEGRPMIEHGGLPKIEHDAEDLPETEHEAEGLPKTEYEGHTTTEYECVPMTEHEGCPKTKNETEDLPKAKYEGHTTTEDECVPKAMHELFPKNEHEHFTETGDEVILSVKHGANAIVDERQKASLKENFCDKVMKPAGGNSGEENTASDELFSPEDEFDDITDDDWWECQFCGNYNYDGDVCELCGQAKPSDQLEDLVTDLEDDCWQCEDCGEFCFDNEMKKCAKCAEKRAKNKKDFAKLWEQFSHLVVDDDAGDPEGDIGTRQTIENLMFRLSYYTDRVYLYNEAAEPLCCNISLLDLETSNTENVPSILVESTNRKQALRFLRKWKSLPERKKRILRKAGMVFDDPYQALEAIKMGHGQKVCTNRFPSKEKLREEVMAVAVEKNGTVRHCTKTHRGGSRIKTTTVAQTSTISSDANEQTWIQAVDENGRPLCIFCKSIVNTSNTNCEWDERFCSHQCKENYQFRLGGGRVRQKLFEEEQGVCQRCNFDAHDLYRTVSLLPKAERRAHLANTPFVSLPATWLNKIILDPKEGMFWEADHVVPVVEGGGECGLENYRTLCVPCHRQVTAELRQKLKANRQKAKTAGIPDITSFFKP